MTDGRIYVHAHYLAPDYLEALHKAERWLLGGIPVTEWSPQLTLEFMDAHGIAMQLLSVTEPAVEFVHGTKRSRSRARATTTSPRSCASTRRASARSRCWCPATSRRPGRRQRARWTSSASRARQITRFGAPAKRTAKGTTGENSDRERLLGDVR